MFNLNVTNILGQINDITNKAILKYPSTVMNSDAGDVYVHVNMEALDQDPFEPIGIYDVSEFLSVFKLFGDERTVTIDNNVISVQDSNTAIQYNSSNLKLLSDFDKDLTVFAKTEATPTVAELILTNEDIKKIKQASGVFKDLTEIEFTSQDGEMKISLSASNKFNAKSNTFSVTKEAATSKEFSISIPVENFSMLPNSDYSVYVKYNDARKAYRLLFASTEVDDLKIIMAINK